MTEMTKKLSKAAAEKKKRILEAEKSLHRMQKEIAPFIKRRTRNKYSTAGKWTETSNLYS